jgi:hypothetical protein
MRRVGLAGLAILGVCLLPGPLGASVASAHRVLQLEVPAESLSSGTRVDMELNFTLAASRGPVECRIYSEGPITSDATTDLFTAEYEHDTCEGSGTLTEGGLGVSRLTLGVKGKATIDLAVGVDWPAPNEGCVYSSTKLRGSTTLSGWVIASFSRKLSSANCGEHRVLLSSTYFYMNVVSPPWERVEDSVSIRGMRDLTSEPL